jgi:glycine/D-amino acid oxidase-like deaminating enzyme
MALHSLRVFQDFEEHVGGECGFTRAGFVIIVEAKDRAGLEANIGLQRSVGIQTELLSPEGLAEVMPGARMTDLMAAAYEPESGYADPYATVNGFAQAARRHGARVIQNTEGTSIRIQGDKVVGVETAEADAVVDADDYNKRVDFDFVLDAGERLVARYPGMEHSESTGGYASLYGITPDWHPIVDELIPDSGLFICAGFSGHGFKLGPAVGLMVADMPTGESAPAFDPHLFRLSRYAEGDPVCGQYEYSIVG